MQHDTDPDCNFRAGTLTIQVKSVSKLLAGVNKSVTILVYVLVS